MFFCAYTSSPESRDTYLSCSQRHKRGLYVHQLTCISNAHLRNPIPLSTMSMRVLRTAPKANSTSQYCKLSHWYCIVQNTKAKKGGTKVIQRSPAVLIIDGSSIRIHIVTGLIKLSSTWGRQIYIQLRRGRAENNNKR